MNRKILLLIILVCVAISAKAQLSDLHYLPPLKQASNNQAIQEQAVYLSTPETATFAVQVYLGTNSTPIATINISNTTSGVYNLTSGDNNITLVSNDNTGIVLKNSGLRFVSPSGNKFYVNYRGNSSAQAASLTSKGRIALGTKFKWGGVLNLGSTNSISNTLGIMATEDNTTVNVSGYDPDCTFRKSGDSDGITDNSYQITLNANETFVFEAYVGISGAQAQKDGWLGASIVSDKDIAISLGSLNFGRVNDANRDAGIDQIVPENKLGKEYVFIRGNGTDNIEFPSIVAIADNTQIFVNGGTTPIATINNGEYFEIPGSYYSSSTAGGNMFVETSKDAYAYQCLSGATAPNTLGLNFIAPVNCLLPDSFNNIPDIKNIAGTSVTGGVTIIAAINTPDDNIVVTDGTGVKTKPASSPVVGSADWKTYFVPNLEGDVKVQSTGPMAVGFFGYSGVKGVAGYFSGFDTVPVVELEIIGGGQCLPNSDVAEVSGNFDAYEWYFDGELVVGENGPTFKPTKAGQFFCRATKGPCTYDSQSINVYYCDPDIIINKTIDKSEIIEGETANFQIKAQNFGVLPLTNFVVTDNVPSGLTITSYDANMGSWNGSMWNIGTLNSGEIAILNLEVVGDEIDIKTFEKLVNKITHTQDQVDSNITSDIMEATIIVHNDFDKDGVIDIVDIDDDNDGIYDGDECSTTICFESIVNESFEEPGISNGTFALKNENAVPGWETTATDGIIEVWGHGFLGVPAYDGNQFVELNAYQPSALYQNLCLTPGTTMKWSLRHRGRAGVDVMQVRIGSNLSTATVQQTMSDGNTEWGYYSGTYEVPLGQVNTSFIFEAVSTSGGGLSVGNLIDDIQISVESAGLCDDNDNDGYPDNLDLDSDNDGCSDANEYYKDSNADGGDGGEYGTGLQVDPNTGAVIGASYTRVLAPEIRLGNTSENLGGTDINNQEISLGQTFEYVLRFQNTGDDDATKYVIRDVLPSNVTFNSVNTSNALGTTYNYDVASHTLNFAVPNNLVEVGDPEYSIRITVKLALNCSDFVEACSSTIENKAFSTYNGKVNTAEFTDEEGSDAMAGCPVVPEVASNSVLSDLTSCSEARTVQLCGENTVLTAGAGFTTYNWVLDSNNNGQVDSADVVQNDGDPDGDPSTLFITKIGSYIVQKTADGSCPDLVERITVERFGTTQTNPIVSYFNQVNSDANPDNDMQGEIVNCSIDGAALPKIFLCGANDEATIQLGITDAQSIVWEKLNEASCAESSDDCANKNSGCTWSQVATDDNITLNESGEYRVVIIYQNGCFSRFYFNVFKNELDVNYTASDILCNTHGNIRITNVGSGYGFQLVDTGNSGAIVVPFSAANGPNFDIADSGTYRVQVTPLDPVSGSPIENACVFETEDIGILEREFSVTILATPAFCDILGTISVQALNVLPNYSYALYLDDGTNAGAGSLVSSQPTNTDNTFTFKNVNPGDYIVVTKTQDGCLDTQNITVGKTPDLKLTALTTQNISCSSGIVTLTPSGGNPNPNYNMAIWSKNGVDLYTDATAIPADKLETDPSFLFANSSDAGEYTFVVIDDNDCYTISNSVKVLDLGTPTLSASHTTITCADSATATLTVDVTGGTTPYTYSIDGTTFQTTNKFVNLAAGLYTITVKDASNNAGTGCIETLDYEIDQPFRLTASAAIVEDASCNAAGALVKILNANGGEAPYQYSFDGGSSFTTNNELNLSAGDYDLVVKDNLGCTYPMQLTVPSYAAAPSFNTEIDYSCDGLATVTMLPSDTTNFTYSYALNGTNNTPEENAVFTNVVSGTQTVTVAYANAIQANQSTLFYEDFGAGPNTQIGEIGPGYCYEPQDGTATTCNLGPAGILVNGEYTVTSVVTNPNTAYLTPNDHTALTNGRFLAIDVSTSAGDNGILWARRGVEVVANQDVNISLWAYNLLKTSGTGNNPEILVELVDVSGTVIASSSTAEIPKNTSADDWHNREVVFNPGTNTVVDIVLRTNVNSDVGNDLILDDIQAYQLPVTCSKTEDVTVVVEDAKAFLASLLTIENPSCNGSADGAIRFEVLNFNATTGFEYSTDGTTWVTSLVSPVTTSATLTEGTYQVLVRKIGETTCTSGFEAILTQPAAIVPELNLTDQYTCLNSGATLTASATGGTPSYEYQLEDATNTIVVAYQNNTAFKNITEGNYVLRVKDVNGCDIVSTTPITVTKPEGISFNLSATACYDGLNNASVTATVTDGNGDYQFRINSGSWTVATAATTHTFSNLSNGTYNVEVTDAYGCVSSIETITIKPQVLAKVEVVDISSCADGTITVTPSGGAGTYVYAFVTTGSTVQDSDFGTANVSNITGATADYDVYIRDNDGNSPYCEIIETVTVKAAPTLAYTANATNAVCYGDKGSIAVNITAGRAPYTYELVDVDNSTADEIKTSVMGTSKTYFNLLPGAYNIKITDALGCENSISGIEITQPDALEATIKGITPVDCTGDDNDFGFAFNNYPTTLGVIQFSANGGTTWTGDNSVIGTTDHLTGYKSGSTVNPAMRTVDASGNTVCFVELDPFIIPYPLDDLDISISTVVVDCNELQVTVQGSEGVAPYEYAYSDNPANFNTGSATWIAGGTETSLGATVPAGEGMYRWHDFIPGRTYVFYVRDFNGCIRQSNVNVNDITTNPMEITADYRPSCFGTVDTGEITYTIVDSDGFTESQMNWALYDVNDVSGTEIVNSGGNIPYNSTITVSNLGKGEYYIVVTQVDASNTSQCKSGSENLILEKLKEIKGDLSVVQNITCESPGIIAINNVVGGGDSYTYTVTGPSPFVTITNSADNPIEIPANSPSGDYVVQITDEFGCASDPMTIEVTAAISPTISDVTIDNCSSTPLVTITASPSAASFYYSIDGGATYVDNNGVFKNVTAGTYTVFIKDNNGCTDSQAITVQPTLQASAVLQKSLGCGTGEEAEIEIAISEGSGNYDYEIIGTSGTVIAKQALSSNPFTASITTADTYTVNVYDTTTSNPVCNRSFTVEVPAAVLPDFTVTTTPISCNGSADGSITLTQNSNGNNPLTYSLSPNNGNYNAATSTYEDLPSLPSGTFYTVTATGPNGCQTEINTITIAEPDVITFDVPAVEPFGCSSGNTTNNAYITINTSSILGGSGNYIRYEFIDVATGNMLQKGTNPKYIYTDILGGDVNIKIYDDNGCSSETTVTVAAFDVLGEATVTIISPISCATNTENIRIDVDGSLTNSTANLANYEFKQLPSGAYQASNLFSNLATGSYTFAIRNVSTGCEITTTHSVSDPNTFSFDVEKLADVVCFGGNGSIRLLMADATYSSSFSWNIYNTNGTPADRSDDGTAILTGTSTDFGPTAPISVPGGSFLIEVIQDDFPSCSQVKTFSITTPSAALSLNTIDVTNVGCSNDQGTASITPVGGLAPYTITLTNNLTAEVVTATAVNAKLFDKLGEGEYTVEVTDALGCSSTFTNEFELVLPDPITGTISATDLMCYGDKDSSVSVVLDARNISATYRYTLKSFGDSASNVAQISVPQLVNTFDNVGPGFYSIVVEDEQNCTFETALYQIIEPVEITAMLTTVVKLGCATPAELQVTAVGGTGPYEVSEDGATFTPMNEINGSGTHLIQNLSAGTYQYYVRDDFNCVSMLSNAITIEAIADLNLDVDTTAAVINCNNESTAVIIASATGGLGNYQYGLFADQGLTTPVIPYQASGTFADLPQGTYYVNVQSEDCQYISDVISIVEPESLVVSATVSDVLCFGDDDGSVVFDVSGGSGGYQFAISPNLNQFSDKNTFEDLASGDYQAMVQDINGCFELITFTIAEPEELAFTSSVTPEVCFGDKNGVITVAITGGTAPYSTAINSSDDADFVTDRLTIENLEGGDYLLYIKDANGCSMNAVVTIESGANLNATAEVTYECNGGDVPNSKLTLTLEDETIAGELLYGLDSTNQTDLVLESSFENITPGDHYIALVHADGCINTIDFTVEAFSPLSLTLEEAGLNEIKANVTGGKEGYTYYFNDIDNGDDDTYYIRKTDTYMVKVVDENGCESFASIYMEFIDIEIPNFFTPDGDGENDVWAIKNVSQFPDLFVKIFDRYGRVVYQFKDNNDGWDGFYEKADLPTGDYWYVIKLNGEDDVREFVGNFTLYR